MLHVHRAERADRLADVLTGVLLEPLDDPFVPEIVSVPTRGIERWLAQRLSHRLGAGDGRGDGVCANVEFPPPTAVVATAVAAASGLDPDTDPWVARRMVWPLLAVIDECAGESWCAALGAHLGETASEVAERGRRYATARHLAENFESYGSHRPAMLRAWHAGDDVDGAGAPVPRDLCWQPELWRRLRDRLAVPSPAERLDDACAALRDRPELVALPPRLSLFGPTRLAADHLDVLAALAERRDVHLWLPHPSPALWKRVQQCPLPDGPPRRRADPAADLPRHPLLRSLGRDARELQLALRATNVPTQDHHHPGQDASASLLSLLQQELRDDRPPRGDADRPLLDPDDRSVQVHACHGADRQVEVLREVVLGLLQAHPELEPRDVLVMCPDIETFAPLISASFSLGEAGTGGDATHPGHRLQVRLADRALRQVNPLLDTVAQLLELADSRLGASEVLDLLVSRPVRLRFRLDDDALARARDLVESSGVRWGLDAPQRGPYQLAGFAQNTWSAGLDRLLLGVTMSEDGLHWLGTALPLDDVDSGDAELVGRLAEFVDRLGAVLAGLAGERPARDWIDALTEGLDALTAVSTADSWQASQARAELADVVHAAGPHADTVPLSLADVRGVLADRLRGRPTRANFRTGTLTVATLVPMRSVPHRVVCLLGLDDGVFPRSIGDDGDDVLARDPCVGERDARSEDRQLFLDAVLAATDHLVVIHSGADERTNARRPPAVPLGELLDAIDDTVRTRDGAPAGASLTVRHPLQPFDPSNFTDDALRVPGPFSHDRAHLDGAVAATGPRTDAPPFLAAPLPPVPSDPVPLESLARFVEHPAREFLKQRVGISTYSGDDDPSDRLPVTLDNLQRWAIGNRLLRARLAGSDVAQCRQAEWRRGTLPPGRLGRQGLEAVLGDVEPLVAAAETLRTGAAAVVDVAAALDDGRRVAGTVGGVHGSAHVRVEYSRLAAKHRLRAWVHLLALTVTRPDVGWQAVTLGRGSGQRLVRSTLGPVDPGHARAVLADLVALHASGLCEPLPLATKSSHAYARALAGGSVEDAQRSAAAAWTGQPGPENADAAHELVWGPAAPFDALLRDPGRFGALATRLWSPLLDAEETALL